MLEVALLCVVFLSHFSTSNAWASAIQPTITIASTTAATLGPRATATTTISVDSSLRTRRVLILGDSFARTDFGYALEQRLDRHARVVCGRRGKSATGLARPDVFDWWVEADREIEKHTPDLVVVIMGGNDGQDLIGRELGRRRVRWGTPRWRSAYEARLTTFVEKLTQRGARVLWLELPLMDVRHLERKLRKVREAQRHVMAKFVDQVQYVPTHGYFRSRRRLIRSVRVRGFRGRQPLRLEDGVHLTLPGSHYFADKIYPHVVRALGLDVAMR